MGQIHTSFQAGGMARADAGQDLGVGDRLPGQLLVPEGPPRRRRRMPGPEQSTRLILAMSSCGVLVSSEVVGGAVLLDRERGTSVAPGSSPPRNGEAVPPPGRRLAPLVGGHGGQPGQTSSTGRAAYGRVDDQDLVAGLVQAPEAGAGGGHRRLGQAQVADGHRAVVLVADGVAVEVLGHVRARSRSSWGWAASSG